MHRQPHAIRLEIPYIAAISGIWYAEIPIINDSNIANERFSGSFRQHDTRGFSSANLRYMRAFAAAWPDPTILQRVVGKLPWGPTPEGLANAPHVLSVRRAWRGRPAGGCSGVQSGRPAGPRRAA